MYTFNLNDFGHKGDFGYYLWLYFSFLIVLCSFNKLLRKIVFSDLLIASELENNLKVNKIIYSGQNHPGGQSHPSWQCVYFLFSRQFKLLSLKLSLKEKENINEKPCKWKTIISITLNIFHNNSTKTFLQS